MSITELSSIPSNTTTGDYYDYVDVAWNRNFKRFYLPKGELKYVKFTAGGKLYVLQFKKDFTELITSYNFFKHPIASPININNVDNADLPDLENSPVDQAYSAIALELGDLVNYAEQHSSVKTFDKTFYNYPVTADSYTNENTGLATIYLVGSGQTGIPQVSYNNPVIIVQQGKDNTEPTKKTIFFVDKTGRVYSNPVNNNPANPVIQPMAVPKTQKPQQEPETPTSNTPTVSPKPRAPTTLTNGETIPGNPQTRSVVDMLGPTLAPRFKPENKPQSFTPTGVGGELKFKIGVPNATKDNFSDAAGYKPVSIELAPARQSFFDKQGQRVPGAGGGLEFRSRANLVKLNVPGSRPIYQHMGIAEETIEWVGAFVGFDHPDPTDELENAEHGKRTEDAWTSSHGILLEMRKGRELMIELSWIDTASKQEHSVKFSNSIFYRGFIKDLKRTYATSQRVYYSVCFCITNREDLEETAGTDDGVPAALPSTNSLAATLASEAAAETAKAEEAAKAAEAAAAAAATNEFNGNIDPLKNMFNTFSANIEINANDSNSPIPNLLKKLQSFFRGGFEYTNDNAKNLENAKNGLKLIFEEIQIKHGTIFSRLKNPVDKDWIKLTLDPRAQESKDYRYGPEAIKSLHDILVSLHEEYFSNILINPSYKEKDKYNFTFKNVKSTFMYFLELQRNSSKPVPGFDLPRKGNF